MLQQSALSLARAIRSGETRSRTVVEAHLAYLAQVNPSINAVVCLRRDQALAEADQADAQVAEARAKGAEASLPPLLGVPCTIKECFALEGMPNASGLVARQHVVSQQDAEAVARLRAAGAIPLGVTNTSELCMWMETYNEVYGRCNNPYDNERTVGGSSGGEGAAVGSGLSPFGLGSDVGGSIRMPAFFNGVFGHKPSPLLVPNEGQYPCARGDAVRYLSTGPLCRRAEDLEPLLRVLAGTQAQRLKPVAAVDWSKVRVITLHPDRGPVASNEMLSARDRAVSALCARGARHERADLPAFGKALDIWSALLAEGAEGEGFAEMMYGTRSVRRALRELVRFGTGRSPHTFPLVLLALLERISDIAPQRHRRMVAEGLALREQLQQLLGDDGLLVYSPYPTVAPRHYKALLPPFNFVRCAILNVMEVPATSVPMGLQANGLPLGVQLVAGPDQDHLGLAGALVLEQAHGGWVPPWTR